MSTVEMIILGIFDHAVFVLLLSAILSKIEMPKRRFYTVFVIKVCLLSLLMPLLIPEVYTLAIFFLDVLLIITVLHICWQRAIRLIIITTSMAVVLQILLYFVTRLVLSSDIDLFFHGCVAQISLLMMVLAIKRLLPLSVIYEYVIDYNRFFNIISLNIAILAMGSVLYFQVNPKGFVENSLSFFSISLVLLILNGIFLKKGLENQHHKQMNRVYEEYLNMVISLVDEVKVVQHEYDNHIQSLRHVVGAEPQLGFSETARLYIETLEDRNGFRELIKLEKPMVIGIVFNKYKKATEANIGFILAKGSFDLMIPIKPYQEVELLGILLDNAIESCTEQGDVHLQINCKCLVVKNTHPYVTQQKINEMLSKGFSTKGSQRGYGLTRLKQLIIANNGCLEISNESIGSVNHVVFQISFPC